jgi:hypothetical protein
MPQIRQEVRLLHSLPNWRHPIVVELAAQPAAAAPHEREALERGVPREERDGVVGVVGPEPLQREALEVRERVAEHQGCVLVLVLMLGGEAQGV